MSETATDTCEWSRRADGKLHSWRFDGDDPYVICVYCDEMRDAIANRVIRRGKPGSPSDQYKPGANWASKDGKRNVVIDTELHTYRCRAFAIRNLTTDRVSRIEISGLDRKFRFIGFDHAYVGGGSS